MPAAVATAAGVARMTNTDTEPHSGTRGSTIRNASGTAVTRPTTP